MERRRPAAVAVLPPSASAEARPAAGSFLPPLTSPHERTEGDRGDAAAAAAAAAAGAGLVATSKRRSAGLQARTSAQVGGARKSQDEQAKAKEAHAKARWNHAQDVCRIVDVGLPVDVRDGSGNTLLMTAAQNGHEMLCRMLIERGADVNACNSRGNTALHFSYGYGYVELGEYLRNECEGRDDKLNDDGESCYDCFTMAKLRR